MGSPVQMSTGDGLLASPSLTWTQKLLGRVTSGARELERHSWRGLGPAAVPGTCHLTVVEDRLAVWASYRIHKSHP